MKKVNCLDCGNEIEFNSDSLSNETNLNVSFDKIKNSKKLKSKSQRVVFLKCSNGHKNTYPI